MTLAERAGMALLRRLEPEAAHRLALRLLHAPLAPAPGPVGSGRLATRLGQWASDALVITLGAQGALAVTTDGAFFAQPPPVQVVNTAGAGDALDGGILLALSQGADWPAALALGTAAAASVVMNEGTALCRHDQVTDLRPQVQVLQLDQSQFR